MNRKKERRFHVEPQSLSKTATRIRGLDETLSGGIPTGRMTLITGGAGTGKTVLGLEMLLRGASEGQPGIFLSFEETNKSIRVNTLSMGWDISELEDDNKLVLLTPEIDFDAVIAGSYSLHGLLAILDGHVKRIGAKLVVIDALDMLMGLFSDPRLVRSQFVILHRWLHERDLTVVMTVKALEGQIKDYVYLDFMADCVIVLDQRVLEQITTRRLHVVKYRGSDFASREHPFVIAKEGIVVMPISFVELVQQPFGEFVTSENEKLDRILGGGFRRGSSVLISGPSGSGKTTLAFALTVPVAKRGEKVLYISFEQSKEAIVSEMEGVSYQINNLMEQGTLRIKSIMPESMGMEELLYHIVLEIDEYEPRHLVIDAVSATNRIGSSQAAAEFLIRLYNESKKREITCIYTKQTILAKDDHLEITGVGISSLVDSAILLHYFREKNRIGRSLLVLKSRGTHHSDKYHEFHITDDGIVIEDPVIQ